MLEAIYTFQEAAKLFKIDPMTLKRMVSRKDIKAFKVGDCWRIKESELSRIMDAEPSEKPSNRGKYARQAAHSKVAP